MYISIGYIIINVIFTTQAHGEVHRASPLRGTMSLRRYVSIDKEHIQSAVRRV